MGKTSIEWTRGDDGSLGYTWNPVRGCSRVSEGCRNCYAERFAARMPWGRPFAKMTHAGPRWTGVVRLIPEMVNVPLHWKKPRRVFVNSMSDLFHESLSAMSVLAVFEVMARAPQHTFQVLTKRPERMRYLLAYSEKLRAESAEHHRLLCTMPLPNVWLGVSVEDQATADERIPVLLETPAVVRFISYEPAVGPADFEPYLRGWIEVAGSAHDPRCDGTCSVGCPVPVQEQEQCPRLDWVIVGGESGPGARSFDAAWARSTVAQCKAAGVAVFVKQMGRWVLGDDAGFSTNHWLLADGRGFVPPIIGPSAFKRPKDAIGFSLGNSKGGDPTEWPADLRVREFPA